MLSAIKETMVDTQAFSKSYNGAVLRPALLYQDLMFVLLT